MAVIVKKPEINLREELTDLRNQPRYAEQQFWMDGLVTNGTFDTSTGWTLDTGWSINVGGFLQKASGSNNAKAATTPVSFVNGRQYRAVFDYTDLGSDIRFGYGTSATYAGLNANPTVLSGTGTKTINFTVGFDGGYLGFHGNDASVGQIDDLYVFETDGTDIVHRLPRGWKPTRVYEDGLLQREGASDDYEVVYDGFDYFVKPAVAPSATTQTCVIGVKA